MKETKIANQMAEIAEKVCTKIYEDIYQSYVTQVIMSIRMQSDRGVRKMVFGVEYTEICDRLKEYLQSEGFLVTKQNTYLLEIEW